MITVTAASHFIACLLAFFTSMELQKLAEVHGLGFGVFFFLVVKETQEVAFYR